MDSRSGNRRRFAQRVVCHHGQDARDVSSQSAGAEPPDIDALWNYRDPAATEAAFRALLPAAHAPGREAHLAELLTQIARTQGLQQQYAQAHATLDEADARIAAAGTSAPQMTEARVRSLLERGRTFNSSGKPETSLALFEQALELAQAAGLENRAVDAAHMLGIAARGDAAIAWNERAMAMAEAARDPAARGWLGALYNNLGWIYYGLGRYGEALLLFEKDTRYRTEKGRPFEAGIARWSAAKTLRALGRVDEALAVQRELLVERADEAGTEAEGYTQEEIGECLLLLGRTDEARPHFARAWQLLRENRWLRQDEPQRLARLQELGGVD
jgi:tetratricopeptide (TPR) repeat protein